MYLDVEISTVSILSTPIYGGAIYGGAELDSVLHAVDESMELPGHLSVPGFKVLSIEG